MKFFIVLCGLLSVSVALDNQKHVEMAKATLAACEAQEGGTQADSDDLLKGKIPDSRVASCMLACVHEKVGVFKDGKFDKSVFLEMSKLLTAGDEKLMKAGEEIADECSGVVDGTGDRCDNGKKFENCIHEFIAARNIDIGFF